MATLSLSIVEIIVLMLGAIVLGFTIHFFISSSRNLKKSLEDPRVKEQGANEWKLKYFNEVEVKDRELVLLRKQLEETEENNKINSIEAEETRKENKKLQQELEIIKKAPPVTALPVPADKKDYYEELRQAKASLLEQNEKISKLIGNIDFIKESEEKQKEIEKDNEELNSRVEDLQTMLAVKEKELNAIRQKATLSKEMASMLDNAYTEFNTLQEKMRRMETQVNASKKSSLEYEELKETHYKMEKDFEEQRLKLQALSNENHELQSQLQEAEDKWRESNFHRQQLQKRVSYLEELNNDMQTVSDANKRLEGQIKRIGELESMLNMISEERDQLIRKHP